MFLTQDGAVYIPKTAQEIADEIITNLNARLSESEIRAEDGNIVQIEKKASNVTWLLALAVGGAISDYGFNLQACAESLDFTLCTGNQLKNLLPIAGQALPTGKKARVTFRIKYDSTAVGGLPNTLTINEGTVFLFGNKEWLITHSVTLTDKAGFVQANFLANTTGEVEYSLTEKLEIKDAQEVGMEKSTFDKVFFSDFSSILQGESEGEGALERVRQNILNYKDLSSSYLGTENKIRALPWVRDCLLTYNYSYTTDLDLGGGVKIGPRKVGIFIYGSSPSDGSLAEVWWQNQLIETESRTQQLTVGGATNSEIDTFYPSLEGLSSESSLPKSFVVNYYPSVETPIHIQVKYKKVLNTDVAIVQSVLKEALIKWSASLTLGITVTSSLLDRAFSNITDITVIDTKVSLTNSGYKDSVEMYPYQIPTISDENIVFDEVEG